MKKMLMLLLVALCVASVALAEEVVLLEVLDAELQLSRTVFTGPADVTVTIRVRDHDTGVRPAGLRVYYPDGTPMQDSGDITWTGTWRVTENQLQAGKVRFGVEYMSCDERGNPILREGYITAGIISQTAGEPVSPVLMLPSTPGAGFDWFCESDNEAVVAVTMEYVADSSCSIPGVLVAPGTGSNGRMRVAFTGLTPGEAEVTLNYTRTWREETPIKTTVCRILVDGDLNVLILSTELTENPDPMFLSDQ